MQYVHIRSLEKYHPGYKDRELKWSKVFFKMVQGDPDFEMIKSEIDKWRFVGMVCLELESQKPLPNDDGYWSKKFDIKKRPMPLTLQMLHNFIDFVTESEKLCDVYKEEVYKEEIYSTEKDKEEKEKEYLSQASGLLTRFSSITQEKIKVYIDRARQKNKSKIITNGRQVTLITELYNTRSLCNNDETFNYALEQAIGHDAPCIGYVNAVIKNKKTMRPR